MTVYSEIKSGQRPSKEALEQIRKAEDEPIVFDEDCPEYPYEELMRMRDLAKQKKGQAQITLDLTEDAVKKARAYGNNYRTMLSRLLSMALDDKDMVRRALLKV